MRQIFFLSIFVFCGLSLQGQEVADTIWVEPITDTTFAVAIGTMNKTNNKLSVQYIDQVFDSVGVAQFAYSRIAENENSQRKADLTKLEADALTRLYSDVNGILNQFTGRGYLANSFDQHYTTYIGYYRARLGNSSSFFQLKADGTAVEVNRQGQQVQGGFSGTWDIINENRWRLKDFFPVNVLPAGSVLNRLENPQNRFLAIGSDIVVTKIRATGTID